MSASGGSYDDEEVIDDEDDDEMDGAVGAISADGPEVVSPHSLAWGIS